MLSCAFLQNREHTQSPLQCLTIHDEHLLFSIFQQLGGSSSGRTAVNPSTSPFERFVMAQKKWPFEFTCYKNPAGQHVCGEGSLIGGATRRKQMFFCVQRDCWSFLRLCWKVAQSFLSYNPRHLTASPILGPCSGLLCLDHRNSILSLQRWGVWNWEGSFMLTAQLPARCFKAGGANWMTSEGRVY